VLANSSHSKQFHLSLGPYISAASEVRSAVGAAEVVPYIPRQHPIFETVYGLKPEQLRHDDIVTVYVQIFIIEDI